tara:strand:- start:187 stop:477 length:291 start_codon:yes stop_codon:yes gene_type:complete
MITIEDAILALVPNAEFVVYENKIIQWDSEETQPTEEEIETKKTELETEYNNNEYQRNRADEYPDIGDQLDYIYHNGLTKWKSDMIKPVKDKYPKE